MAILQAAVDSGSFNRAATQLGLTQPAVSRNIGRLEAALGCRLLNRSAVGVTATESAEIILRHFNRAASEIRVASQELALLRRTREASVACAGAPVNIEMIAAAAASLRSASPPSRIHILEGATPGMLELLVNGELDIVVGSGILQDKLDGVVTEPLLDEEIGVFVGAHNPLANSKSLRMNDLLDEANWVMPDSATHLRRYIDAALVENSATMPENLIESRSATAMRWLVHHTDCIAISTSLVHRSELRSGEVVMVDVDWDFSTTKHVLYRRRRHAMSHEALALVDAIKAEARGSN